ncbi:MAG TPA: NifU family protein [Verrucomicrobiae bacterium]|nr:NifU family protein [Verrucomicrobiae bacterium]
MKDSLHTRVQQILNEVQPMLGMHGGAIELVDVSSDNIVSLRFKGACVGCSAADVTLEYGLKEMLMIKCEEISDVIAVNDEPVTHDAPATPLQYVQR